VLRITKIEEDGSSVTLKVEGRIMSEGVDVLELECLKWLDQNEKVQLECSAVSYIDGRGVEMLKSMAGTTFESSGPKRSFTICLT